MWLIVPQLMFRICFGWIDVKKETGETEKTLQAFARIYEKKNFSKQSAYKAFAGVSRKKYREQEQCRFIKSDD